MKTTEEHKGVRCWVYATDSRVNYRYVLGVIGVKNLICIGVNPSTATPGNLDRTLSNVDRIARANGFDGWLMLNLSPQIATDPKCLSPDLDDERWNDFIACLSEVKRIFAFNDDVVIWAAWGDLIGRRPYLDKCLRMMRENLLFRSVRWVLTSITKEGNPHHPLYQKADTVLSDFEIEHYLASRAKITNAERKHVCSRSDNKGLKPCHF